MGGHVGGEPRVCEPNRRTPPLTARDTPYENRTHGKRAFRIRYEASPSPPPSSCSREAGSQFYRVALDVEILIRRDAFDLPHVVENKRAHGDVLSARTLELHSERSGEKYIANAPRPIESDVIIMVQYRKLQIDL